MVTVTTSEPFKNKTTFTGTVVRRTDAHVVLSAKGRIVQLPRELVAEVKLPAPQFEPDDYEVRKLR